MINWIVVLGTDPSTGWERTRHNCWFPDFDHQEYMLPMFDVGDEPIDPYDATEFKGDALLRLRSRLVAERGSLDAKAESWSIVEHSSGTPRTLSIRRAEVRKVLDQTLEMIDFAIRENGAIRFCGD